MSDAFADFLRKHLTADAAFCRELAGLLPVDSSWSTTLPTHAARVLVDVDLKLRILDVHVEQRECERCAWLDDEFYPCETLRLLTLTYVERAGYEEGWKP